MPTIVDHIAKIVKSNYKIDPVISEAKNTITVQIGGDLSASKSRIEIGKTIVKNLPSYMKGIKIEFYATGKKSSAKYFIVTINGVKKNVEVKEFKEGSSRQTPLAPAQVQSSGKKIVNSWLTVNEFVSIVKKHINSIKMPETDKKTIIEMIDDCTDAGQTIRYSGNKKLVPSEFFEVLSSVKLATLLDKKDSKICEIFGLPKNTKVNTIHIYIPQASNYPLTDYEISINGAHLQSSKKTERSTHKISVKSKVASAKTNTVKFTDIFDSKNEVEKWRKRYGNDQRVQGEIALSGLSYPSGKKSYFPLNAFGKVIDQLNVSMDATTKNALKKVSAMAYEIKNPKEIIVHTHYGMSKKEDDSLRNFLNTYVGKKRGTTDEVPYTLMNVEIACEKFFEKESISNKNLNFYQMFYDSVLKEKSIAYSIAKVEGNSIKFNYYSSVNWKSEYSDWVSLRTKNAVDLINDTMGLDL